MPPVSDDNPYASEPYLRQLLTKAVNAGASDIHLKVGQPPGARLRGGLVYFRMERIRPEDTLAIAHLLMREAGGPDLHGLEGVRKRVLRPRTLVYATLLAVLLGGFAVALSNRNIVAMDVIRDFTRRCACTPVYSDCRPCCSRAR